MKTRDELIDDLLTLAFAEEVGDGDALPSRQYRPRKPDDSNSL